MIGVDKWGEANRILNKNLSARYRRLDKLERYVEGTQYEGMPHFTCVDLPVYERAPLFVYPIAGNAIKDASEMCLSEGRWPCLSVTVSKKRFDNRFAISRDDAEILDELIANIVKQAHLEEVCIEQLESAMGCGTSVAVLGVDDGHLCVEMVKAKWCVAKRNPRRRSEITQLEIRYPYIEEFFNEVTRRWEARCMLYRRVITTESDVTFLPAKASQDGAEPDSWIIDQDKVVDHGFGFCPVVWYAYRQSTSTVNNHDGNAIHARQLDEIDALNYLLSQRHVSSMVAASPTVIEIGVDKDYNPAPMGRSPVVEIHHDYTPEGVPVGTSGFIDGNAQLKQKPARKQGPGVIWRYDTPASDTSVAHLTLPGDALKPVDESARDEKSKISEAMGVIFIDPDNAKFSAQLSGKALYRLYDRMVRLCSRIRMDFGNKCLSPLIDMLLRICLAAGPSGGLYLDGLYEALSILERFAVTLTSGDDRWFSPPVALAWGPYFEPDPADETAIVTMSSMALEKGLITKATAVTELTDVFDIGNVDDYLLRLEKEVVEREQKAADKMKLEASLNAKPVVTV